jgi:hypothetical protein
MSPARSAVDGIMGADDFAEGSHSLGPAALDVAVRRVDFAFRSGDKLTLLTGNPLRAPQDRISRFSRAALAAAWYCGASIVSGAMLILVLLRALKPEAR